MYVFLFGFIVLFVALGVPIAVAFGLISASTIYFFTTYTHTVIAGRMLMGIDSYVLLAIPLFILAGRLMNEGKITERIFNFARSIVGWIPGGIAHTNVVASVIFAGMSGSAVADAAGLGVVEIKAMEDHKYDKKFACAVTGASATVGTIIPPSIPMLLYAMLAEVSIGRLFLGGIVPGLLMAASMMLLISYYAVVRHYPRDRFVGFINIAKSFGKALPALMTPVIILGGLVSGVFTVTEAAATAAFYALVVSLVYGDLDLKKLPEVFIGTAVTTAVVVIILAGASVVSWLLVRGRVGIIFTDAIMTVTTNPWVVLLLLNVLLLILGCFLELGATMILLVPILRPMLLDLGIDMVHFGVVMIVNLMIGFISPPFGMSLFVVSEVGEVPVEDIIKDTLPFVVPLIIVLLTITYVPSLVLAIPRALMPIP